MITGPGNRRSLPTSKWSRSRWFSDDSWREFWRFSPSLWLATHVVRSELCEIIHAMRLFFLVNATWWRCWGVGANAQNTSNFLLIQLKLSMLMLFIQRSASTRKHNFHELTTDSVTEPAAYNIYWPLWKLLINTENGVWRCVHPRCFYYGFPLNCSTGVCKNLVTWNAGEFIDSNFTGCELCKKSGNGYEVGLIWNR